MRLFSTVYFTGADTKCTFHGAHSIDRQGPGVRGTGNMGDNLVLGAREFGDEALQQWRLLVT